MSNDGMTDTIGRMHSDAQFAGSSSVPAHVEMMGFLGIGNNPTDYISTVWLDITVLSSMDSRLHCRIAQGERVQSCLL